MLSSSGRFYSINPFYFFCLKLGDFIVLENDDVCAVGKVRSPPENSLMVQNIIHEKQNRFLDNELSLDSEDIYKELRIMGYDYSGEFRRLKKIRTNDFKHILGTCEWNGSVVTFLDALLQTMAFESPIRKLMVPVMIKTLRIDPKVLLEAITQNRITKAVTESDSLKPQKDKGFVEVKSEVKVINWLPSSHVKQITDEFCFFKSQLHFYYNSKSKLLVTHGIEVEDVEAFPIPRKVDTSNLVLNSYEFVGNEDNSAIDECDRKNIIEYLEVLIIPYYS